MGVCASKSADIEVVEAKQSEKSAAAHSDSRLNVGNGFVQEPYGSWFVLF